MASMERSLNLKKGAWTEEEDNLLRKCVQKYGEGRWYEVPLKAGLNRCRKSCRIRWMNYLKPNINRGEFREDEVDLIIRLHNLLGNKWSLIARRLSGRTANDVKNYWNTHISKKSVCKNENSNKIVKPNGKIQESSKAKVLFKPRRRKSSKSLLNRFNSNDKDLNKPTMNEPPTAPPIEDENGWWKVLTFDEEEQSKKDYIASVDGLEEEVLKMSPFNENLRKLDENFNEGNLEQNCWNDFFGLELWNFLDMSK